MYNYDLSFNVADTRSSKTLKKRKFMKNGTPAIVNIDEPTIINEHNSNTFNEIDDKNDTNNYNNMYKLNTTTHLEIGLKKKQGQ